MVGEEGRGECGRENRFIECPKIGCANWTVSQWLCGREENESKVEWVISKVFGSFSWTLWRCGENVGIVGSTIFLDGRHDLFLESHPKNASASRNTNLHGRDTVFSRPRIGLLLHLWSVACVGAESEACVRRVFDFDVSRWHSVGANPVDGVSKSPALVCGEEFFCATQMYGDGDLSLTSTSLVDERVPSTQACADDLPPVSKREVTGAQRSSVDSGVVAGGSLNRADSTRAGATLTGSTANFGAEQGEQVGQTVVSDTHVAIPASFLLWVRVLGFKTHQESCFVTTSLRSRWRRVQPVLLSVG